MTAVSGLASVELCCECGVCSNDDLLVDVETSSYGAVGCGDMVTDACSEC